MSEENNFHFNTGGARLDTLEIEFSDGRHALPAFITAHILAQHGSTKPLTEMAHELRKLTFDQFVKGFNRSTTRESLNAIQQRIIHQHLRTCLR